MTTSLVLTDRDILLLEAVALKVRLIGLRQIADALWQGHIANARRRLKRLVRSGLLRREVVPVRPLPELSGPVCQWQPGAVEPDVEQVSSHLKSRWHYQTMRATTIYLPTNKTIDHFGGRTHHTQITSQVTHDLGVTAVWLWFLRYAPQLSDQWQGEDTIAPERRGDVLPDALLIAPDGKTSTAIEFGGSYGAARLAAFHDDAVMRGLPYQIW